jgi:hypothetical protein
VRFAVKRLTKTDLSFFEPQYRRQNKRSGQKSINLNRDPFVDILYPDFPAIIADRGGELEVPLRISGPGAGFSETRIARKISKGKGYKNYRLNGEFVPNPDDAATRFDHLQVGDVAVFAFDGAGQPSRIRLFVLSAAEADDVAVLEALRPPVHPSMSTVGAEALSAAVALAPPDHPLRSLFLDPSDATDLEEAALGGAAATRRLLRKPGTRRISVEELAAARRRAEDTGREGEQLISDHFERGVAEVSEWVWRSADNAIHPWDFDLRCADAEVRVEVKATRGDHTAAFHISMAELEAATEMPRYDIYRVSSLGPVGGELRIAEDVGAFAARIVSALEALPDGVRPDGFTVRPALLERSDPLPVAWLDADEG